MLSQQYHIADDGICELTVKFYEKQHYNFLIMSAMLRASCINITQVLSNTFTPQLNNTEGKTVA